MFFHQEEIPCREIKRESSSQENLKSQSLRSLKNQKGQALAESVLSLFLILCVVPGVVWTFKRGFEKIRCLHWTFEVLHCELHQVQFLKPGEAPLSLLEMKKSGGVFSKKCLSLVSPRSLQMTLEATETSLTAKGQCGPFNIHLELPWLSQAQWKD